MKLAAFWARAFKAVFLGAEPFQLTKKHSIVFDERPNKSVYSLSVSRSLSAQGIKEIQGAYLIVPFRAQVQGHLVPVGWCADIRLTAIRVTQTWEGSCFEAVGTDIRALRARRATQSRESSRPDLESPGLSTFTRVKQPKSRFGTRLPPSTESPESESLKSDPLVSGVLMSPVAFPRGQSPKGY